MSSDRVELLKTRAESFARNLQNRLRSLSESQDTGWTDTASVDSEVYYDIDSSLASPEEEVAEPIFIAAKNRDALTLQRSDSEASTYFDTVEDEDELSAPRTSSNFVPPTKKLPLVLLHLRNEILSSHHAIGSTSLPNGNTNGHAGDLESSEQNFDSLSQIEQEIMENENNINGCMESLVEFATRPAVQLGVQIFEKNSDNNQIEDCLEENNNEEEEAILVELNLNSIRNLDLSDREVQNVSVEDISKVFEEGPASPESQFCVFCDIEQIKSSLSNTLTEESLPVMEPDGEVCKNGKILIINGTRDKEEEVEESAKSGKESKLQGNRIEDDSYSSIKNDEESRMNGEKCLNINSQDCSLNEDNLSIKDLLIVLKEEVAKCEINTKKNLESNQSGNVDETSQRLRPSIEVTGPSSSSSEVKQNAPDEEFNIEEKRKHFRRSSSLKTGKTPPNTPGRKKIVRFADVLGLDLADVKTFLDEVPTIPMSAFNDLHGIDLSSSPATESANKIIIAVPQLEKILSPLFQQPCVQPNFLDRVRENNVCLENAVVSDSTMFTISGVIRVKNIDFHKSAYVRYTINGWKSFSDLQARYVPNSCDGFSDKFTFVLYAHTLGVGQKLEFAVRFHTAGAQFWDSNSGANYIFECISLLPKSVAAPPLPNCPMETASFY